MVNDLLKQRRAAAQARVRERDASQMARLLDFQRQVREMDEEARTGALDPLRRQAAKIRQERDAFLRARARPDQRQSAPNAGTQKEALRAFDRRLAALEADRSALLEKHAKHEAWRARRQAEKRAALTGRQAQSFERRVREEMQAPRKTLTREFSRQRGPGRER